MKRKIDKLILTVRYWLDGDNWHEAKLYASVIVNRWTKRKP